MQTVLKTVKMLILDDSFFNIFLAFPHNIDFGYTLNRLSEVVLTRTHNLCFRAKTMNTPVNPTLQYKSGVLEVINHTFLLS